MLLSLMMTKIFFHRIIILMLISSTTYEYVRNIALNRIYRANKIPGKGNIEDYTPLKKTMTSF